MGKDLGAEIERAVEDLGVFQDGGVGPARDSAQIWRSKKATWANIAERVCTRIGSGFRMTGGSVRHYCAAKRSH